MSDRATAMNPRVLRWARERIGFSLADAARAVGRSEEVVEGWEAGTAAPTFRQLETLASCFKRPVAVFFFPDPPPEPDLRNEFRTLPLQELEELDPDTRFALREARAWQQSLRELTEGQNPAERRIVDDLSANYEESAPQLAARVREYLGVPLEMQQRWPDPVAALKGWRAVIESVGVFIFKRSFGQRSISGFCLHDREFPIVVINNSTAHARQIFTLFHELAHLLFHVSGITREGATYLGRATGEDRAIEVACDNFAAEFLVPTATFPWNEFQGRDLAEVVPEIANRYNVSRAVVLRKLLVRGLVDSGTFARMTDAWNHEFLEARSNASTGGNYYATQATYLGDAYLRLAFGQYRNGRLSLPDLADHLGMKARNVRKLEDFLIARR